MPIWKISLTCAISEARRIGLESPSRTPTTSSRQSICGSIWISVIGPRRLGAQYRDRDRVVAAQNDRQGASGQELADSLFAARGGGGSPAVGAHVAAVDRPDGRSS